MSSPFAVISFGANGRPATGETFESGQFKAESIEISSSWSLQPAQASMTVPGDWRAARGCGMKIELAGHTFWGFCRSAVREITTSGDRTSLQFVDSRIFLNWDCCFCSFNQMETVTVNGTRIRRWRHLYPVNYYTNVPTFTDTPLTAAEIIQLLLNAPTVKSSWSVHYLNATGVKGLGYHAALDTPVYNVDCMSGQKLGTTIASICDQLGLVFTVMDSPYHLVFARKGQDGTNPVIPAISDNQRAGETISDVPTHVTIVGGRNTYQVHDIDLEPDWASGWTSFFGYANEKIRDYIYNNLSLPVAFDTITAGTYYNKILGDTYHVIGMQLAAARALEMTVAEFANHRDATHSDGNSFRDWRKFSDKPRMAMSAALYCQNVLFRAYRIPAAFTFVNRYGHTVALAGLEIVPEMFAFVNHDPSTGRIAYDANKACDGNGYVISKGYQIGEVAFANMRPEAFDPAMFSKSQEVWQAVGFQVDESSEQDQQFIVLDQPMVVSDNLFTKGSTTEEADVLNGYSVICDSPTFTTPLVRACFCFAAERYLYTKGSGIRDDAINVSGLCDQCVCVPDYDEDGVNLGYTRVGVSVNPFPDQVGDLDVGADPKAEAIADSFLARQFFYTSGGYRRPMFTDVTGNYIPTRLNGMTDRVTVSLNPREGLWEEVDFTAEREPLRFIPDREFERMERDKGLFSGQQHLNDQANLMRVQAMAFRRDPKSTKDLVDFYNKNMNAVFVEATTGQPTKIPAGTPIWKKPPTTVEVTVDEETTKKVTNVAGKAHYDSADLKLFAGVSVVNNVDVGKEVRVQNFGLVHARVKGPVTVNDLVGAPESEASNTTKPTYFAKNEANSVGKVLQEIATGDVRMVPIQLGTGGGGGGEEISRFKITGVSSGFLTCNKYISDTDFEKRTDDPNIPLSYTVAMPRSLRNWGPSGAASWTIGGKTYSTTSDQVRGVSKPYGSGGTKNFTWSETIYPQYVPYLNGVTEGDEIYAIYKTYTGFNGVYWVDMNLDGRCWQVDFSETAICENNVKKLALFHRTSLVTPD
jgi:hypothetical protein